MKVDCEVREGVPETPALRTCGVAHGVGPMEPLDVEILVASKVVRRHEGVTLKEGVSVQLKQQIPEIREVVDATDHAAGENPYYA